MQTPPVFSHYKPFHISFFFLRNSVTSHDVTTETDTRLLSRRTHPDVCFILRSPLPILFFHQHFKILPWDGVIVLLESSSLRGNALKFYRLRHCIKIAITIELNAIFLLTMSTVPATSPDPRNHDFITNFKPTEPWKLFMLGVTNMHTHWTEKRRWVPDLHT